jgi:hypothetical protein
LGEDLAEVVDRAVEEHLGQLSDAFAAGERGLAERAEQVARRAANPFMAPLGPDLVLYSALTRSLDSAIGIRLERIARSIAQVAWTIRPAGEGELTSLQLTEVGQLLEAYGSRTTAPDPQDIAGLPVSTAGPWQHRRHGRAHLLTNRSVPSQRVLLHIASSGDWDQRKARAEKQGLLENYLMLRNAGDVPETDGLDVRLGVAYNKFGEGHDWTQSRVLRFFAPSEVLVGSTFWNFIADDPRGFDLVVAAYERHAGRLRAAIQAVVDRHGSGHAFER